MSDDSVYGFEPYIIDSPTGMVQCTKCSEVMGVSEQYGHIVSNKDHEDQKNWLTLQLLRLGQGKDARARAKQIKEITERERKDREARGRDERGRERGD